MNKKKLAGSNGNEGQSMQGSNNFLFFYRFETDLPKMNKAALKFKSAFGENFALRSDDSLPGMVKWIYGSLGYRIV